MIYTQIFKNRSEYDTKKYKASLANKKVTLNVNVQLWSKSYRCFLNMSNYELVRRIG